MKHRFMRWVRAVLAGVALAAAACGQNPDTTERARGVLTGANLVLSLTIVFIVVSGALLVGVIGLDRFARTRRALESAPPEEAVEEAGDEAGEEVVAGIGVGRAGVPRWLYGFYVLLPVFAFLYVVNNVALRPVAEEQPGETKGPTGPQTEVTIVASGIKFDLDRVVLPAKKEITVEFENKDAGVPHNFTVWPDEASAQGGNTGEALHAGSTFNGDTTRTEKFTTPEAGKYYFNCTVHPTAMFGTVEVVEGAAVEEAAGEEGGAEGPATEATIAASGIKFDKDALVFPAETEVTVTFENKDTGVPHDFTVWQSEEAATANDQGSKIANTNQITGESETKVSFKTPGPGKYYFNCTVHPPSMFGTVEVVAG